MQASWKIAGHRTTGLPGRAISSSPRNKSASSRKRFRRCPTNWVLKLNSLRKPCISFALNNGNMIPCGCENHLEGTLTMMLGRWLLERPGFMHNPEFDTSQNLYFASHCTCAEKLHGPQAEPQPFDVRSSLSAGGTKRRTRYITGMWRTRSSTSRPCTFSDRRLPGDSERRDSNYHRAILAISTAFWDTHLCGDKERWHAGGIRELWNTRLSDPSLPLRRRGWPRRQHGWQYGQALFSAPRPWL